MPEAVPTPGQTVGPFFGIGLPYPGDSELVTADNSRAVRLHGTVYDGAGVPVPDALIELWQPDADGRVPSATGSLRRGGPGFTGFGRSATDAGGRYGFTTVAPGRPFFAIAVFARGLLDCLFTRAYLPGADPALPGADPARLRTLLCAAERDAGLAGFRFDIHLQGPDETVFLEYAR
jgi:protocatechuate 3,4-dioxygenase, alpha subunit